MKWYRNNWFYVGAVLFMIQAFILIFCGSNMDLLTKIMFLSFMALNVHQFEEYVFPGGFPMVMNMAFMGETEVPDRYIFYIRQESKKMHPTSYLRIDCGQSYLFRLVLCLRPSLP